VKQYEITREFVIRRGVFWHDRLELGIFHGLRSLPEMVEQPADTAHFFRLGVDLKPWRMAELYRANGPRDRVDWSGQCILTIDQRPDDTFALTVHCIRRGTRETYMRSATLQTLQAECDALTNSAIAYFT
jgi:hypothetical protein